MIEERKYSFEELSKCLGSNDVQGIKRKLDGYGVEFERTGRGRSSCYTITKIKDPFKVFSIMEMGFPAQTDWEKFRNFMYVLLCDDDFGWRPDEMKEEYLRKAGKDVSRQTIAKYINRLEKYGIIGTPSGDYKYYKVFKEHNIQKHEIITKQEYCAAWKIYWQCIAEGYDSRSAYKSMYNRMGGVPRKSLVMNLCPFYEEITDWILKTLLEDIVS